MMISACAHGAVYKVRVLSGERDAILVDFSNIGLTMTRAEAERLRDELTAALRQPLELEEVER
jgi:hypothetical protein